MDHLINPAIMKRTFDSDVNPGAVDDLHRRTTVAGLCAARTQSVRIRIPTGPPRRQAWERGGTEFGDSIRWRGGHKPVIFKTDPHGAAAAPPGADEKGGC